MRTDKERLLRVPHMGMVEWWGSRTYPRRLHMDFAFTNLITKFAEAQANTGLKLSRSQKITNRIHQEEPLSTGAIATQGQ